MDNLFEDDGTIKTEGFVFDTILKEFTFKASDLASLQTGDILEDDGKKYRLVCDQPITAGYNDDGSDNWYLVLEVQEVKEENNIV